MKSQQSSGIEQGTPGLWATALPLSRQLDNQQPSQSSMCTAQVVVNALRAATQHELCLRVEQKIRSAVHIEGIVRPSGCQVVVRS